MHEMALEYPGYGIEAHKGYGTKAHFQAIATLGACEQHRRSWNLTGVKKATKK
jgi:ribonuclease HII